MKRFSALVVFVTCAGLGAVLVGCGGGGGGGGAAGTGTGAGAGPMAKKVTSLEGAGSSFVDPIMQKWATVYSKDKGVAINYSKVGSGAGITKMTKKETDFGCTDAAMTDDQLKKAKPEGGDVIHIPLVMGAVVPAYNLEGNPVVKFSGKVLGDIFLGKIKKWNDPALKDLNPDVALPDLGIAVAARADSSGTSYIWTDFLNKTNPDWAKIGVNTSIDWPVGSKEKGNDGVANYIKNTKGALGYVELIYALNTGIKFGAVQNAEGKFVAASLESVTAAAENKKDIPDDLRFTLTNEPGEKTYPISGTVFAVVFAKSDKGPAVAEFLKWVVHDGQAHADALHYSKLPQSLVTRIDGKLAAIK